MTEKRWKHWAYLNDEGKKLWGDIFPDGIVPVKVMLASEASLEGQNNIMRVYMISLEELTPEQIENILTKLANKFNAPKEEIRKDMLKSGMPLRVELTNGSGTNQMGLFL